MSRAYTMLPTMEVPRSELPVNGRSGCSRHQSQRLGFRPARRLPGDCPLDGSSPSPVRRPNASDQDRVLRDGQVTVAGLLALGEYPQQHLPHCTIRAALQTDDTSTVRALDSATFTGPIAAILDDAVDWVARNSRNRIVQTPSGQVTTQLDPPAIAVRELVANALVHRQKHWTSGLAVTIDYAIRTRTSRPPRQS